MTTVDYYPKRARLDFIAPDGMVGGGIIGDRAHVRAAEMIMNGTAIVRICGIDSKMNKGYKNQSINPKTLQRWQKQEKKR